MSRIKRLFAEHRWPWNVLTALCLLLGVLLLLRDRPGCPDVVVMHSDLARLTTPWETAVGVPIVHSPIQSAEKLLGPQDPRLYHQMT